jgi:hypothetical protein
MDPATDVGGSIVAASFFFPAQMQSVSSLLNVTLDLGHLFSSPTTTKTASHRLAGRRDKTAFSSACRHKAVPQT